MATINLKGWTCDLTVGPENATNLTQLTLLDRNVMMPLYTCDPALFDTAFNGEDIYNIFEHFIGDNVNALYMAPTGVLESDYSFVSTMLPSASKMYPNAYQYSIQQGGKRIYLYLVFNQFGTCLRISSSSSSTVYQIVENELTSPYSSSNGPFVPVWFTQHVNNKYYRMWSYGYLFSNQIELTYENLTKVGGDNARGFEVNFAHTGAPSAGYLSLNDNTLWMGQLFAKLFGSESKFVPPSDVIIPNPPGPYDPGGPSGPTDPDLPPGTFDDESDPIPDSPLPTLSAANTGFTRIYNPTLSQVQALARYLWTDESVIETIWNHIKQFFENPMEAIIGFNLVPVPVPDGGIENFALMYIDTGVPMTVAANQFVDLDCGNVELKRYYGSALDQSPYTKVSCFLPYIGTVNLNTDEVMGTTLQVKYRVDIVSGSCVAKIFVDGNCLYQYSGHCAINIPISSADFSSYVSAAISVGKLAAAAITAGAGAAMAAGVAEASQQTNQVVTTTQVTNTTRNPATGRQITTGTTTTVQTRESPADQSSTQASFSGLSPQNVANTVGAVMSSKPHIEHSGSFSGNSGYLGVRRPFLIIERPNMCMPANYQALNGFPAMITMELSTCEGFTRVQQVQLTGMGRATNPEQAEILELLKSGVIL